MEVSAAAPLMKRWSRLGQAVCYHCAMDKPNPETRTIFLVLALIAAFEIFRPAPAMTQRSSEQYMRDVVYELRGIRQELSAIQRKMK